MGSRDPKWPLRVFLGVLTARWEIFELHFHHVNTGHQIKKYYYRISYSSQFKMFLANRLVFLKETKWIKMTTNCIFIIWRSELWIIFLVLSAAWRIKYLWIWTSTLRQMTSDGRPRFIEGREKLEFKRQNQSAHINRARASAPTVTSSVLSLEALHRCCSSQEQQISGRLTRWSQVAEEKQLSFVSIRSWCELKSHCAVETF